MTLSQYHKKRNFKKTQEPRGNKKTKSSGHLYLIQKHAASHLHYDFRIEMDGVLKSWAVPKGPSWDPGVKRLAVHVEDHPLEYGSFEGIIPQGEYGGGTVMLWDQGTWEPIGDAHAGYAKGDLTFNLYGERLKGAWKLIRIKRTPKNWLLIKIKDKYASKKEITRYDRSVVTNKLMDEIANNNSKDIMPSQIIPELATLMDQPPGGEKWLHEIKLDGYRLIAFIKNKNIRLMTRGQQDWTDKFPAIVKALKKLNIKNGILDGEIVVLDENQHSNFQLLQNSIKSRSADIIYYLFDIIYYQNKDLTKDSLINRKEILRSILMTTDSDILRYSDHIQGNGKAVFRQACKLGLEGIVSKQKETTYQQKRTRDWIKTKCTWRQEFVVGGFTKPKGTRDHFGSLLIGVYNNKKELVYSGHVGTGFSQASLKSVSAMLKKYVSDKIPFKKKPPASSHVIWIKPNMVVEVEFSEWTKEGIIRHPSFKGLRIDKSPLKIKKESIKR